MGEFSPDIRNGGMGVVPTPFFAQTYGCYRAQSSTGTMAAGLSADSQIWQFRWAPSSQNDIAIVHRVVLEAVVLGTGFTAGTALFQLFASRSNTVAGSGGGTLTMTTNNAKKRTAHATSKVSEIRTSTTATLTAATETLDSTPLGGCMTELPTTADIVLLEKSNGVLYEAMPGEFGAVLAYQEGLVIKATVPATGTWRAAITVEWSESHKGAY